MAMLVGGRSASGHDHVARSLAGDIMEGVYAPGEVLPPEAEILDRFGVSRTVLREALKTLAAKGLIVSKTRVGTSVLDRRHWNYFDADLLTWRLERGMDKEFFAHLVDVRLAFEPAAARLAAERKTPTDIENLRQDLLEMAMPGHTPQSFADIDLEFHLHIAEASGNPLMASASAVIATALQAAFSFSTPVRDPDGYEITVARHQKIADAIEAGNGDAAAEAMRVVIDEGATRVLSNKPAKTSSKAMKKRSK